jgi:hypothetical protein
MHARTGDAAEYAFFTVPGASVNCCLGRAAAGHELQIFGNRAGLLSLANVFLWFLANSCRRELLSFGELDYMRLDRHLSVTIRLSDEVEAGTHGALMKQDSGESIEWAISEEGLQAVGLLIHRLASRPEHEYDRLLGADRSDLGVEIRMSDASEWLQMGMP